MPIPLIAAGVAAAGAVAGGAIASKGASKAAKASQASANAQIAATDRNRDYQYGLNQPTIDRGRVADDRISALLNLGGDVGTARAGFDEFRKSTGYDFRLDQGEDAINANAYARGAGRSGATYKRLLEYGQEFGSNEFGKYLGQLGGVSASGASARSLVAGVGTNTVNTQAQALQANGTNQGNAAIAGANIANNTIGQLIQAGGYALGSSYGPQRNTYGIAGAGGVY